MNLLKYRNLSTELYNSFLAGNIIQKLNILEDLTIRNKYLNMTRCVCSMEWKNKTFE